MEIRIGIQNAAREVALESNEAPADVNAKVAAAIKDGSVLTLTDEKGRTITVPGDKIAFVEVGVATVGKVGFAS
jgi:hypothetical protein